MIRVIKRYESRKLYDTEESRYVSLDDIAAWVQDGQEVQVIDNSSSEDVTAQILTQVILDGGKRGRSFLPTELLHQLVREGERAVETGVEQVQDKFGNLVRRGIDRLSPIREARDEMAQLRNRLTELESTLQNLEASQTAEPTPEKKVTRKRSTTRKAAAKKPAAKKPAAKKTAAPEAAVSN